MFQGVFCLLYFPDDGPRPKIWFVKVVFAASETVVVVVVVEVYDDELAAVEFAYP